MGWGDELMAIGHARVASKMCGSAKVQIVNHAGLPRWDDAWQGVPFIYQRGEQTPDHPLQVRNGPGCRPYLANISYDGGSRFNPEYNVNHFRPQLWLGLNESIQAVKTLGEGPFYVIEPHMIAKSCQNKKLRFQMWQQVAHAVSPSVRLVQLVWDQKLPVLNGVTPINVKTFRESAAIIAQSLGVISGEGGMIHCAAACDRPATVVLTGFTPKGLIAYDDHSVVYNPGHDGCGRWKPCPKCQDFIAKLDWRHVFRAVEAMPKIHMDYWSTHMPIINHESK